MNFQLSRRAKLIIAAVVLVPIVAFVLWTWSSLTWSFANGNRTGYVQKFSKMGWVCKTWEGELSMVPVPGSNPEKFYFTVRDDSVATLINQAMGKQVTLAYEQHKGVPTSCFGLTEYFVTGVRAVK